MKQVDQTEFAEETVAELRARVEELEALFQRMLAVHWGWVALEAQQRKRTEVLESSLAGAAWSDNVLAAAEASAVADASAAAWATRVPCEHCPSYGIASLAGRWLCRECIDLIAGRNQTADAYPEMLRAATARLSESLANEERERHEALTLRALVKELEARLAACARAGCPTAAVPCEPRANLETGDANVQIGPAHLVDEPTSEGDL